MSDRLTENARIEGARIGSLCSGYGGLDLGLITALGMTGQDEFVEWTDEHHA